MTVPNSAFPRFRAAPPPTFRTSRRSAAPIHGGGSTRRPAPRARMPSSHLPWHVDQRRSRRAGARRYAIRPSSKPIQEHAATIASVQAQAQSRPSASQPRPSASHTLPPVRGLGQLLAPELNLPSHVRVGELAAPSIELGLGRAVVAGPLRRRRLLAQLVAKCSSAVIASDYRQLRYVGVGEAFTGTQNAIDLRVPFGRPEQHESPTLAVSRAGPAHRCRASRLATPSDAIKVVGAAGRSGLPSVRPRHGAVEGGAASSGGAIFTASCCAGWTSWEPSTPPEGRPARRRSTSGSSAGRTPLRPGETPVRRCGPGGRHREQRRRAAPGRSDRVPSRGIRP
jgi:hypothetical protein